jgi:hypothetical protein
MLRHVGNNVAFAKSLRYRAKAQNGCHNQS